MGLLALMATSVAAQAQALYLADFAAYVDGEEIYVSWTTKKGFTCENIQVQLGTDSNEVETVYTYLGVCGGELKEEHYFYRIPKPFYNQDNYIRLNLGVYGYSEIVVVKPHKALEGTVLVFPHPATNSSTILFHNPQFEPATFEVYNMRGELVTSLSDIRTSKISVADLGIPAGVYYINLLLGESSQRIRLVKAED